MPSFVVFCQGRGSVGGGIYVHIYTHTHTYAYISTYCTLMHLENWLAFNAQLAKLPRDLCSILTLGRNTRRNSGQASLQSLRVFRHFIGLVWVSGFTALILTGPKDTSRSPRNSGTPSEGSCDIEKPEEVLRSPRADPESGTVGALIIRIYFRGRFYC